MVDNIVGACFAFLVFLGIGYVLMFIEAPAWMKARRQPRFHVEVAAEGSPSVSSAKAARDQRAIDARNQALIERINAADEKFSGMSKRRKKFVMGAR